ncbi:hypothetical protein CR513_29737, partial [Mucuna pruriens]
RSVVEFFSQLGIKQSFTSVEHPQTNGHAESANKVVLKGQRKRLEEAKGRRVEELPQNEEDMRANLDFLHKGDFVLKRVMKDGTTNKLTPNWEGHLKIIEIVGKGAFQLERLDGKEVPRTCNSTILHIYYS